jgi:predicted aldo/keto reductase-like oxidoreductase
MKTDYIDIYLMHAITSPEDVENRLKGGVLDALVKAKQEGLIGHIGFSGHSSPFAHNYLIDKNFEDLEVVLLPVNPADVVQNSFILNTVPKANEKNMGVIGMKIFAGGGFFGEPATWGPGRGQERERVIPDILTTREAQHFAYSLPIGAMTIGCHDGDHVRENVANTRSYNGITQAQYNELIERVTDVALKNPLEHYKDPA